MNAQEVVKLAEARRLAKSGRGAEIRKQAGISMGAVAAAVGVSRTTVLRWERGTKRPSGEPALRWVALLRDLEEVLRQRLAADYAGMSHISSLVTDELERLGRGVEQEP